MKVSGKTCIIIAAVFLASLVIAPNDVSAKPPPGADLVSLAYDKSTGLAALSPYELFTSKDGVSWNASGLTDRGELLTSVAAGAKLLLVGTNSGKILVSADGTEFSVLAEPKDPFGRKVSPVKMLAIGPKGRYIAASSGQGVVRSIDSGKTWKAVKEPYWEKPEARQILSIGFIKNNLIVVTRSGPYLERNGKFVLFLKGLPENIQPTVSAFGPGRALLALNGEGLFLARGVRTWKKFPGVPGDPLAFVGFAGKGYLTARAFSPVNVGDSKGKKWKAVSIISADFVPVASASTPKAAFMILRGRGLVKLKGMEFEPVQLPVSLSSVLAELKIGNSKLAGTQGGVFITSDGEKTWMDVTPTVLGKPVNAFLELKDGRILLASDGMGVFASEDDGRTWKEYNAGLGTANTVRSLVPAGNRVLAATENGVMVTEASEKPLWASLVSGIPRVPVGSIVNAGGKFWVASHEGVFSAGKNLKFKPVKGLEGRASVLDAEGKKVITIINRKVLLKDGRKKATTLPPIPGRALPSTVLIYRGTPYTGTSIGLFRWTGNDWEGVGTSRVSIGKLARSGKGIRVVTSGQGTYYLNP